MKKHTTAVSGHSAQSNWLPALLAMAITTHAAAANTQDSTLPQSAEHAFNQQTLGERSPGKQKVTDKEAANRLITMLGSINSFSARFTQTVENEYGQLLDESSGRFLVQRPSQFRWQTETQTIVADGRNLWTYDSDLEQVTIQSQGTTLANSPVTLLTGNADSLAEQYNISLLGSHLGTDLYQLTPKAESAVFEKVQLLARGDKIIELLFNDALGQKTVIRFTDNTVNQQINMTEFSFSAPEGADIVDSRDAPAVESEDTGGQQAGHQKKASQENRQQTETNTKPNQ